MINFYLLHRDDPEEFAYIAEFLATAVNSGRISKQTSDRLISHLHNDHQIHLGFLEEEKFFWDKSSLLFWIDETQKSLVDFLRSGDIYTEDGNPWDIENFFKILSELPFKKI